MMTYLTPTKVTRDAEVRGLESPLVQGDVEGFFREIEGDVTAIMQTRIFQKRAPKGELDLRVVKGDVLILEHGGRVVSLLELGRQEHGTREERHTIRHCTRRIIRLAESHGVAAPPPLEEERLVDHLSLVDDAGSTSREDITPPQEQQQQSIHGQEWRQLLDDAFQMGYENERLRTEVRRLGEELLALRMQRAQLLESHDVNETIAIENRELRITVETLTHRIEETLQMCEKMRALMEEQEREIQRLREEPRPAAVHSTHQMIDLTDQAIEALRINELLTPHHTKIEGPPLHRVKGGNNTAHVTGRTEYARTALSNRHDPLRHVEEEIVHTLTVMVGEHREGQEATTVLEKHYPHLKEFIQRMKKAILYEHLDTPQQARAMRQAFLNEFFVARSEGGLGSPYPLRDLRIIVAYCKAVGLTQNRQYEACRQLVNKASALFQLLP